VRNWIGTWDEYEAESFEYIDAEPHVVVEQVLRGRSKETGLSLDARHWNMFTLRRAGGPVAVLPDASRSPRSRVGLSEQDAQAH
jgi:hypothetical protein